MNTEPGELMNGAAEPAGNAAFAKGIAGTAGTASEEKHTGIGFRKFSFVLLTIFERLTKNRKSRYPF